MMSVPVVLSNSLRMTWGDGNIRPSLRVLSLRREEAMDLETTILVLVLFASFMLFGIGMFGFGV
jgi:hypothetical protein